MQEAAHRSDEAAPVCVPEGYRTPDVLSGLPKHTPLLLGFSGGVDSSVLLHLTVRFAKEHGTPLRILHLHHGIRGAEADRDATFAKETAARYGIPISLIYRDIPAIAKETGESIEAAARRERYLAFESVMREYQIPILLTAHNADDQFETVLFHLLRGSGLSGLCGIPEARPLGYGTVVRPLLRVSRKEISAFADNNAIPFVYDSTNADSTYTRNRLRNEIVPALRAFCPAPERSVARMTDSLARDRDFLDALAEELLTRADTETGLSREILCSAHDAVLIRALSHYWQREIPTLDSYESVHLEALLNFTKNGRDGTHLSLRRSVAALKNGKLCITAARPQKTDTLRSDFIRPLTVGTTELPEFSVFFHLSETSERNPMNFKKPSINNHEIAKNIYNSATQIAFSFDTIDRQSGQGALSVRKRMPGDRILSNGMHRSLRTLCNAAHLTAEQRQRLLVVVCGDEILWVPGIAVRDGIAPQPAQHSFLLSISRIPFL